MIRNSRGKDHQSKKEGVYPEASTSSRQWWTLKNPRIVCVSRLFRGKDRHSKVVTVKGLRDRRVRLSVPTAIQLYDLQDKLGLDQPSKVVDWLLNAAQHEINKLPPLQMLPGDFNQLPQSMAISHEVNPLQALSHPPIIEKVEYIDDNIALSHPPSIEKVEYNVFGEGVGMSSKSTNWYSDAFLRTTKEATREWSFKQASISKENQLDDQGVSIPSVPVSNHVNVNGTGHSLFQSFLNNAMPFASYHLSEPSNAGNSHFHSSPVDIIHNYNSTLMLPSLSLIPGSQQELCPSGMAPSMFLPYTSGSTDFHAS